MTEHDPYVWPDSGVLANRLGLRTQGELVEAEYALTLQRRLELQDNPVIGQFDLDHFCAIHRHLFQDLFDWAGHVRTVDIAKGTSTFLPASRIKIGATFAFGGIHDGPLLRGDPISQATFIEEITDALDRINYLHPFREGNGRTQRTFLDLVAGQSGQVLTWRNVTDAENLVASVASVSEGRIGPLREMIAKVVLPPIRGSAGFDVDAYQVLAPESTDVAPSRVQQKCRRCGEPLDSGASGISGFHDTCWLQRYE